MTVVGALRQLIVGSLARRLVAAVVLVHTALIALLLWELVIREGNTLENQRVERGRGVAAMLATSGASWMLSEDSAGLAELIDAASSMNALRYSMFIDPAGRLLAHTDHAQAGKKLATSDMRLLGGQPSARVVAQTSHAVDVAAPVFAGKRLIGWSWVSISLADIRNHQMWLALSGLGYGAAAILLGLFLAIVTARNVTGRLAHLASVSDRIRMGERSVRVTVDGCDEVAKAGSGVNAMLETIEQTERSLREAQKIAQLGSWRYEVGGAFTCSDSIAEMFGLKADAHPLTFKHLLKPLPTQARSDLLTFLREGREDTVLSLSFALDPAEHGPRTFWGEVRIGHSQSGQRVLTGVCQDITEREAAAAQLRQAQKMEAVGQLTGGLAHDFNNLLAILVGNLDLLDEELAGSEHHETVSEALAAALRGAELTRQLLAFARRQPLAPRSIDLNQLISGIAPLWRRTLGEQIEVHIGLSPTLWMTRADPSQVESAVLNLIINARDAMPGGGVIRIETSNVTFDPGDSRDAQHSDVEPGDYSVITVSDTGVGMSAEVAAHAFEPFFTTKKVGEGSGLGLSMIYGFAKQSGGHVKIYSEPGHGTAVRLYLPRAAEGVDDAKPAGPGEALPRAASETVLLVEDNESVRKVAARQLDELGYKIISAASGPEALALLRNHPEIDLIFTDIVMPGGMTGIELASIALAERPGLKVLHTSGFAQSLSMDSESSEKPQALLNKPYRKTELAFKLREVLDASLTSNRVISL